MDWNHSIHNEIRKGNQNNFVLYIHEVEFEKDLIENLVENAVADGKQFHLRKHEDLILDE